MDYNNIQLFSYDSKKKVRVWKASSDFKLNDDGHILITIEHGQKDGKMQQKIRKVKTGKNKNKANETTIEQQAALEISYLYQQQLDDGYVTDIDKYVELYRPVLAHKYRDKKHLIHWTKSLVVDKSLKWYASRKLNGIRCFIFVVNGTVTKFESRTGKSFKMFGHIADDILKNYGFKNVILDGELFHPKIPFEMICSLVNSDDYKNMEDPDTKISWDTSDVQFHCYDIVDLDNITKTFYSRFIENDWYNPKSTAIQYVESLPIEDEESMIALATKWIAEKYEGLMLRYGSAIYEFAKRSAFLLKYKVMEQEEFKVLNMYLAENDESKIMCTLQNHHNKQEPYDTFECALKGNKEENLKLLKHISKHIKESWVSVDYQVLSSYNVPLFPVGVVIRQGEVIDGKFTPSI